MRIAKASPQKTGQRMRAVGYVRVSTEKQAEGGISIDAQRTKIQAYCLAHDIELVLICTDNGVSAKTLRRPGLQRALQMLTNDLADALIVAKIDRLSRRIRDMAVLCDFYFREGRPWTLLSVNDYIDTRSAAGRFNLNVQTSGAQLEHESVGERTHAALAELKRQGVALGGAPYGWKYSTQPSLDGRRRLVEVPEEQRGIRRICELYDSDMLIEDICATLKVEGILSRRRTAWHGPTIYRILQRAGYGDTERRRKSEPSKQEKRAALAKALVRDRGVAAARAKELRAQGLSLRKIADQLHRERILPMRSNAWHAAGVMDLLRWSEAVPPYIM